MAIFNTNPPRICDECVEPLLSSETNARGYNGKWFHFDCMQQYFARKHREDNKIKGLEPQPKNFKAPQILPDVLGNLKNGFLLDKAYCLSCAFRINSETFFLTLPPKRLKEELFESVAKIHDENAFHRNCSDRKLVVCYQTCIYE